MTTSNFTPTAHLSPDDYLYASCADPKRTDFRAAPVIVLAPAPTTHTKPRKSSSYTERTKRMFSLDRNDAVASHLMGVKS